MHHSAGDLLDRWSILKLKVELIGNEESIKELAFFDVEVKNLVDKYSQYDIMSFAQLLYIINKNIWQWEAGLKSGKEELVDKNYILNTKNNEVLIKVGMLSILIRNHNAERVQVKNIVNKLLNDGFADTKLNHISEG